MRLSNEIERRNARKAQCVIELTGEVIIQAKFHRAGNFSTGLARIKVEKNKKVVYAIINKAGEYVLEPEYQIVGYFSEGLCPVGGGLTAGWLD